MQNFANTPSTPNQYVSGGVTPKKKDGNVASIIKSQRTGGASFIKK